MYTLHERIIDIVKPYVRSGIELSNNTPLKDVGVESIDVVKIVVDLENYFNIEVFDSDLVSENFSTISVIAETIQKYLMFHDSQIVKAIVIDCDGILWDGIAGEGEKEAAMASPKHVKLQELLHMLREKGVLLFACTENRIENIINQLSNNESPLTCDDFAQIFENVISKNECIRCLLPRLGFSKDCVVFIDDSQRQCSAVYESFILPQNNIYCVQNVNNLNVLFERLMSILPETNIDRTLQFKTQLEREKQYSGCNTPEEINQKLQTKIRCRKADVSEEPRIYELSARANRFNISGNHLSHEDIQKYILNPSYEVYIALLEDRFGDMGLVGFSVVKELTLIEFVVSCRVLHRGVENCLLNSLNRIPQKTEFHKTSNNLDAFLFLHSYGLL